MWYCLITSSFCNLLIGKFQIIIFQAKHQNVFEYFVEHCGSFKSSKWLCQSSNGLSLTIFRGSICTSKSKGHLKAFRSIKVVHLKIPNIKKLVGEQHTQNPTLCPLLECNTSGPVEGSSSSNKNLITHIGFLLIVLDFYKMP